MSRFIFAAFTFMVIFSVATAGRCPANEVYSDCGTTCPATCEDGDPRYCALHCVEGCFCRNGFVRNSKGRCVPPAACGRDD